MIGRDSLPQGYHEDKKEGMHAEFRRDGSLAHYGCYRDGKPVGWQLYLDQTKSQGSAERRDEERFPDINDNDGEGDPMPFDDWAQKWIDSISDAGSHILKCSFCGKKQTEVRKLIAGPSVYICNECIDLCSEILSEEMPESPPEK